MQGQIREEVIAREVFMQEAEKLGLSATDDFKTQMELARQAILIRELPGLGQPGQLRARVCRSHGQAQQGSTDRDAAPIHYGTNPLLRATPAEFQQALGNAPGTARMLVGEPGQKFDF